MQLKSSHNCVLDQAEKKAAAVMRSHTELHVCTLTFRMCLESDD